MKHAAVMARIEAEQRIKARDQAKKREHDREAPNGTKSIPTTKSSIKSTTTEWSRTGPESLP
jgi:hypothetical protein